MNVNKAREIFMELIANVPPEQWQARLAGLAVENDDLRRRVAEGRSIRYQVPRGVEAYIDAHGLYQR